MINLPINERHDKLDRLQLIALAGLMFLGAVFVCSATMANESAAALPWYDQTWVHQIVWYVFGLGAGAALCIVDYHTLARWSFVVYWAAIFFLVLVLIPHIGQMRFGARRWMDLKFFQFQPSEFAKLAFILAVAHFLSRPADELRQPWIFWKGIGLLLLPFALILKEPDLGSRHTQKISAPIDWRSGFADRPVFGGHAVPAARLVAGFDAAVPARPVAGLFWTGLHPLCFAECHTGGVATPATAATGR